MDLNPYKPVVRRNLKRPRFNQHTTKIVHDQASASQITTFITEHSFTSNQSLKWLLQTIAVAEIGSFETTPTQFIIHASSMVKSQQKHN